jgi:hypothetical protein
MPNETHPDRCNLRRSILALRPVIANNLDYQRAFCRFCLRLEHARVAHCYQSTDNKLSVSVTSAAFCRPFPQAADSQHEWLCCLGRG